MILSLDGFSYTYPGASVASAMGCSLGLRAGEILLLTGPTGCGKSTLLRAAAGLTGRHGQGTLSGRILLAGQDPAALSPAQRVRLLGFVAQEPQDQLVAGTIGDELAFALESAQALPERIQARLPELLELVGLDLPLDRATHALSGGQTQRLVCGAALSAGAQVLLLDEPLAQLDPQGAQALMRRLREMADRQGLAVLMVEHRLAATLPFADALLVMESGRITQRFELLPGGTRADADRAEGARAEGARADGDGAHADRANADRGGSRGLSPQALARCLELGLSVPGQSLEPLPASAPLGLPVLELQGVSHSYPGADGLALEPMDLTLHGGERLAIVGANGAGKSTLLGLITGLYGPAHAGVVGVPQDPDLSLFCPTVLEEVAYGPMEHRAPDLNERVARAMAALSISELAHRAPHALSRGQRLRVAVAAALSCAPRVLVLDEPTSGQDHGQVELMMASLRERLAHGALVFATHDLALARRHATTVLRLGAGRVLAYGTPEQVL